MPLNDIWDKDHEYIGYSYNVSAYILIDLVGGNLFNRLECVCESVEFEPNFDDERDKLTMVIFANRLPQDPNVFVDFFVSRGLYLWLTGIEVNDLVMPGVTPTKDAINDKFEKRMLVNKLRQV